jgi:hypothetical protein
MVDTPNPSNQEEGSRQKLNQTEQKDVESATLFISTGGTQHGTGTGQNNIE